MTSLFLWIDFLTSEEGDLLNLYHLGGIFIFWALREKIDILTIVHNQVQGVFVSKSQILGGSLRSAFDVEEGLNSEELLLLVIHKFVEREFPNCYFNFIAA